MNTKELDANKPASYERVLADLAANNIDLAELVAYSATKTAQGIVDACYAEDEDTEVSVHEVSRDYFRGLFTDNVELFLDDLS